METCPDPTLVPAIRYTIGKQVAALLSVFAALALAVYFLVPQHHPRDLKAMNAASFAQPEYVATLPDGREITSYTLYRANGSKVPVYCVGTVSTVVPGGRKPAIMVIQAEAGPLPTF